MKTTARLLLAMLFGPALACSSDPPADERESPPATAEAAEPTCGEGPATLTPTINTYDDSNAAAGATTGRFEMWVYDDATTRSTTTVGECMSDDLLTKTSDPVSLEPGVYDVCKMSGGCACVRVRLPGGPAEAYWEAGPGSRFLVRGCGELVN